MGLAGPKRAEAVRVVEETFGAIVRPTSWLARAKC